MSKASRNNIGWAIAGALQGLFSGMQRGDQAQMRIDERDADRDLRRQQMETSERRYQESAAESRRRFEITEKRLGGGADDASDGGINRNIRAMTGRTGQIPGELLKKGPLADVLAGLVDKGYTPDRTEEVMQILSEEGRAEVEIRDREKGRLRMEEAELQKRLNPKTGRYSLTKKELEAIYQGAEGGPGGPRASDVGAAHRRAGSFVERFDLTPHEVKTYLNNIIMDRERRRAAEEGGGEMGPPEQQAGSTQGPRLPAGMDQKSAQIQMEASQRIGAYLLGDRESKEWLIQNWIPAFGKKLGITELMPTPDELAEMEAMAALSQPQGAPVGGHPADQEITGMRGVNPESRPAQGGGRMPTR